METIIPALIVIALLLLVTFTIAERSLASQEAVSGSWREMQERAEERARTDLAPVGAKTTSAGSVVSITLRNDGDIKLADFDQWDVILQYGGNAEWYPYGSGAEYWTKTIDEAFEPGILNPGEEMTIWVWVDPSVGSPTTNLATIVTPNGITASTVFTN
jgi:hypothetical protein